MKGDHKLAHARAAEILARFERGESTKDLALAYNLTYARVWQIISKVHGNLNDLPRKVPESTGE